MIHIFQIKVAMFTVKNVCMKEDDAYTCMSEKEREKIDVFFYQIITVFQIKC